MLLAALCALALPGLTGAEEVPAAPEKGGPRYWEVAVTTGALNLRDQPSTGSNILARYEAGTILNNLGCQAAEGRAST